MVLWYSTLHCFCLISQACRLSILQRFFCHSDLQPNFKLIANLVHFQGQLTIISFRLIFVEVNVTDPFIGNSIICLVLYPRDYLAQYCTVLLCNPGGVDVPVLGSLLGALLCSLECPPPYLLLLLQPGELFPTTRIRIQHVRQSKSIQSIIYRVLYSVLSPPLIRLIPFLSFPPFHRHITSRALAAL